LIDQCAQRSLLEPEKLDLLAYILRSVRHIEGDLAEFGVYRGGSARLIARAFPARLLYLFDTFAGMPFQGDLDGFAVGAFADTSLNAVHDFLADCGNVIYVPGTFPLEVMPQIKLAFVHVDADQYQSTKDAIHVFWPMLSCGGIMLFDDYHDNGDPLNKCLGVPQAIRESRPTDSQLTIYEHQATLIKR
jgi:predicted O-methyltransferase YrrM